MADEEKKEAPAEEPKAKKPAEEEGGEEGAEGEAAAGGGKKKLMLIIGGAVLALLGVGGGLAFFLLSGDAGEVEVTTLNPNAQVTMLEVPPITVNMLSEGGGPEHFLKAKVALELGSAQDKAAAEQMLPRLEDDWQNFLRQLRPEDTEGSSAMQRLKEALLLRANQALAPIVVHNVLFRELLVQ